MPKRRVRPLRSGWFWLNYAVALALTAPLSLLSMYVNGKLVRRIPIWEHYRDFFVGKMSRWDLSVVVAHLALTFVVCFVVWWLMLRPRHSAEPVPAENPAEALCDTGVADRE